MRAGCGEDIVIAGILHDTLEDGFPGLSREEVVEALRRNFGAGVAELVEGVTEPKDPNMTRAEKERTWEERKSKYREGLQRKGCKRKLEHWQEEIDIFYEKDGKGNHPYLHLARQAGKALKDIKVLIDNFKSEKTWEDVLEGKGECKGEGK